MKDIDEERHGSKTKRQKKDGNRTGSREPGKKPEWKKDGLTKILEGWNYGSKNRNQSHWLKAAYPREYLASVQRQQLEPRLPGLPVSTCLPLPPILFLLLIVHHSSSFYSFFPSPFILCFVLFFVSIFLIPSFLSPHESALVQGGPSITLLPPLSLVRSTPIRGVVSRKFTGNAFVERVYPNSFPR